MKSLFISVVGQDDNIGDSLLRRAMLDALRSEGIQFHLLVGNASDGYLSGLGLQPGDVIYRERDAWIASMRLDRGRGASSFLANAGEIVRMRGPLHLGRDQLPTLLRIRQRGGLLLQTGAGIRDLGHRPRLAKWSVLRLFNTVTWRDAESCQYAGVGRVTPDWGFISSDPIATEASNMEPRRKALAVSIRGDRPAPDDDWYYAVRATAEALDAEIVPFAQVSRDDERTKALATAFEAADVVLWGSNDHASQEHAVRALMRRSIGVVSDRLHALIVGATEGAYPLGLPAGNPEKLIRTLAPAGFSVFLASAEQALNEAKTLEVERLQSDLADRMSAVQKELDYLASEIRADVVSR